jgi:hypothetical protein
LEQRSKTAQQLLTYWQEKRGARGMPARADLDPIDLGSILPNLLLVNVSGDPLDFSYRLIGTAIVERSMADYTGVRLMDLPNQRKPSMIWSLYEQAVTEKSPALALVPYLHMEEKFVEIQALPLSPDDLRVDMLIASVVFEHERVLGANKPAL